MNDVRERVVRTISRVLNLNESETQNLRAEIGYKQIGKWTSARHAEIVVALEDEFAIEIEERAISRLNDVARIAAYVESVKQ